MALRQQSKPLLKQRLAGVQVVHDAGANSITFVATGWFSARLGSCSRAQIYDTHGCLKLLLLTEDAPHFFSCLARGQASALTGCNLQQSRLTFTHAWDCCEPAAMQVCMHLYVAMKAAQ